MRSKRRKARDNPLRSRKKKLQHGIVSGVDVASAETTYQSAMADIASYQTSVAQDKNALDLVVGQRVPDAWLPNGIEQLSGALSQMPADISSQVLLNRPDVLEAEHNLKAANASIDAARANFFPPISLTTSAGVGSNELSSLSNTVRASGPFHLASRCRYSPAATIPRS